MAGATYLQSAKLPYSTFLDGLGTPLGAGRYLDSNIWDRGGPEHDLLVPSLVILFGRFRWQVWEFMHSAGAAANGLTQIGV